MKNKLVISYGIIIALIGMVLYLNFYSVTICSRIDIPSYNKTNEVKVKYSEIEKLGKELFVNNCNVCHKINKKVCGPDLKYFLEPYINKDFTDLDNFLNGDSSKLYFDKEFNNSLCLDFNFSIEEQKQLKEFLLKWYKNSNN